MANLKISQMTAGNPALTGDFIPIARSGANFKITASSIASLATVNIHAGFLTGASADGVLGDIPNSTADFTTGSISFAPIFNAGDGISFAVLTQATGTGTGRNLVGAQINAQNETPDVMTSVVSLQVNAGADDAGGSATTVTALNIADVTGGTTNLAIQTGVGDVAFGNTGGKFGIFAATPVVKQTVTGVKLPSDTVMASLLTALANYGLIVNSTT